MKLFDLSGKVAIVTGGNGGIGLGMARGILSRISLCSTSSNVPFRQVSSAVRHTSPSPCTAWPSPQEKLAPGTNTGRNTDVPATYSLQSTLPPNSRGSTEEMRPYSGRGAVARMPKKGCSGSVGPQASFAVIALRSMGVM